MYVTLDQALEILRSEDIVAIPTETVYGMGANINSEKALKKVFQVKERPFFDPLIIHVDSIEMAKNYTSNWNPIAQKLADEFWPGPLTLVLDKSKNVNSIITAGLDKVGIRMPSHPLCLELITKLNSPIAAPSANKFKKTSPTSAHHIETEFKSIVSILDGGRTEFGIESTVVGIFDDSVEIYRPGVITKDELQSVLRVEVKHTESPVAPGQLKHHYMPNIPITITFDDKHPDELKEDYKNHDIWKLQDDPVLVARELYQRFRDAQENGFEGLLMLINNQFQTDEKWKGVLNRINKAKTYEI